MKPLTCKIYCFENVQEADPQEFCPLKFRHYIVVFTIIMPLAQCEVCYSEYENIYDDFAISIENIAVPVSQDVNSECLVHVLN